MQQAFFLAIIIIQDIDACGVHAVRHVMVVSIQPAIAAILQDSCNGCKQSSSSMSPFPSSLAQDCSSWVPAASSLAALKAGRCTPRHLWPLLKVTMLEPLAGPTFAHYLGCREEPDVCVLVGVLLGPQLL